MTRRQPTRRIPLKPIGNHVLACDIGLYLALDGESGCAEVVFRADSEASETILDAATVAKERLHVIDRGAYRVSELGATGRSAVRVFRRGLLTMWWTRDCSGDPFALPVLIDPNPRPKLALGLGGFLTRQTGPDTFVPNTRWTFDSDCPPERPYGSLVLEDLR